MNFSSRHITIIIVAVVIFFIAMTSFTYFIGSDEDSGKSDNHEKKTTKNDITNTTTDTSSTKEEDPYKELDELIGLEKVKREVHDLADFIKVQKLREKQGLKVPKCRITSFSQAVKAQEKQQWHASWHAFTRTWES